MQSGSFHSFIGVLSHEVEPVKALKSWIFFYITQEDVQKPHASVQLDHLTDTFPHN